MGQGCLECLNRRADQQLTHVDMRRLRHGVQDGVRDVDVLQDLRAGGVETLLPRHRLPRPLMPDSLDQFGRHRPRLDVRHADTVGERLAPQPVGDRPHRELGPAVQEREKELSQNSAILTFRPPASSLYVRALEAPPSLKRSVSVTSRLNVVACLLGASKLMPSR